jgi:uncharacterized peroxidase-related enzyme
MTRAVVRDPAGARLEPRDRAMVDYALKLTRDPGGMEPGDLEPLRERGLDDAAILRLAEVTAYFNYVNRMADGLGVEVEPGKWDPTA